jgi:hypothetical protein
VVSSVRNPPRLDLLYSNPLGFSVWERLYAKIVVARPLHTHKETVNMEEERS